MTRLDSFVSKALSISRKEAKALIKQGRISVDGKSASADRQLCEGSSVSLDDKKILLRREAHIMLNKPRDLICAARDRAQKTIMDLLPRELISLNIQPIGRLDKDVTGLLLLTSDGELNHRLCSPKYKVEKCYEARVQGFLRDAAVQTMRDGIEFKDFTSRPARLEILRRNEEESLARLHISEGKFHQVKKMFSFVGNEVLELRRISFCSLPLDEGLRPGEFRFLEASELEMLKKAVNLNE